MGIGCGMTDKATILCICEVQSIVATLPKLRVGVLECRSLLARREHVKIVKARDTWYSASLWGNLITGALRYGTHCKGSHGVTCQATIHVRERYSWTVPLPSQPKLILVLPTPEECMEDWFRVVIVGWLYLDGLPVGRRSPIQAPTGPDVD